MILGSRNDREGIRRAWLDYQHLTVLLAPTSRHHPLHKDLRGSLMTSVKRRKTKSRPVTSGSKSSTPGPSLNLNCPMDEEDVKEKSDHSEPRPAFADPPSHPVSSSSSSSTQRVIERESEPVLDVIGTPTLPSPSSTPPGSKLKAVDTPYPTPTSPRPPSIAIPQYVESAAPEPFCGGEEFVAFAFSDSDEETAAIPIREWDQRKEGGDAEKRGKKRKSGEMSRDDRDGRRESGRHRDLDRDREKRQRMANVPRYAPWIANVDWERCTMVPELSVTLCLCLLKLRLI